MAQIQTKVTLVGDKEYKSSLNSISTELKKVRAETRAEQAELKNSGTAAQQAASKQRGLQKEYDLLQRRLREHEKQLKNVEKAGQKDSKAYTDISISIAKTREEMAKIKTKMDDVGKGSQDTGKQLKEFGDILKDLTGGVNGLGDGLSKVGKMTGFAAGLMAVKTAAAGISGIINGIANACTNLVNGVTEMVTGAASAAAQIQSISVTTGIPASEMTRFITAAQLSGSGSFNQGSINSLVSGWKGNFSTESGVDSKGNAISNVIFGGASTNRLLASLANSSTGNLLTDMVSWLTENQGTSDYSSVVSAAFSQMGLGADWLQLAQNPQALLDALNSDSIVNVQDEQIAALTTLNGTIEALNTNMTNLKIDLVAPFAEDLTSISTQLSTLVSDIAMFWTAESPEEQQAALDKLLGDGSVLGTLVTNLIEGISSKFSTLIEALANSDDPNLQSIGTFLKGMPSLESIWNVAKAIFNGIFEAVKAILKFLDKDGYMRLLASQYGGEYGILDEVAKAIATRTGNQAEMLNIMQYGKEQGWYRGMIPSSYSVDDWAMEMASQYYNDHIAEFDNGFGHAPSGNAGNETGNGKQIPAAITNQQSIATSVERGASKAKITIPPISVQLSMGASYLYE